MRYLTLAKMAGFFFIFKWFYYTIVISKFLQDEVDYSLANLKIYLLKSFLQLMWILLTNDINIKFKIHPLFDDLVPIVLSLFFYFIYLIVVGFDLKLLIIFYTSFFLSMACIRLAHYEQFLNPQCFLCLLSLLDLLAIIILFY